MGGVCGVCMVCGMCAHVCCDGPGRSGREGQGWNQRDADMNQFLRLPRICPGGCSQIGGRERPRPAGRGSTGEREHSRAETLRPGGKRRINI